MAYQAYYEADGVGDWYEAIGYTAPGQSPASNPELWRKVEIPQFLESALLMAARAHLYRGEGQTDKSLAEQRVLEGEIDRIILQHADYGLHAMPLVFTR